MQNIYVTRRENPRPKKIPQHAHCRWADTAVLNYPVYRVYISSLAFTFLSSQNMGVYKCASLVDLVIHVLDKDLQ